MMTMPTVVADELGKHLADDFRRLFGSAHRDEARSIQCAALAEGLLRVNLPPSGRPTNVGS
jgi:hypothetical protein